MCFILFPIFIHLTPVQSRIRILPESTHQSQRSIKNENPRATMQYKVFMLKNEMYKCSREELMLEA